MDDKKLQELQDIVDTYNSNKSIRATSFEFGITRSTIRNKLKLANELGIGLTDTYSVAEKIDDDIPVDEIVDHLQKRFQQRKKNKESKKWQNINMKTNEPIALVWMGDPHIDDNYCDWDALKRDLSIIQSSPNIYGCNLGDLQNNWIGRLSRLYGEQDTSHKTAWKLVEWLIDEMNPLILIGGNHDMWTGAGDPINWMTMPHTINEAWEARISINFPNGKKCKIHTAHDMSGHSQWNNLHAQGKRAKMGGQADLYISGHKHNWGLAQIEQVELEKTAWLARARGYKYYDTFAMVKGFEQQKFGQSIIQVIDPNSSSEPSWTYCFADAQEGADYLNYRLEKYNAERN
jgi:hypothetical protein